jgi:hypothetical protein
VFDSRYFENPNFQRRLYHNTKPSRSHIRIFKRSPRRERNTNRWPLCGFSPMTARTRSASRSNPQHQVGTAAAKQMCLPTRISWPICPTIKNP